jgi:hypothetical protein
VPWSPRSKIDKFGSILDPENRFLLYSSVYIFRSERSAPGPPIFDHFWKKVQPICGEWTFYRGHLWGSKIGKFLQKSAKFQKIYKKDPPGPPRSNLIDFGHFRPPHGTSILTIFGVDFHQFITSLFDPHFGQFIATQFFDIFNTKFTSFLIIILSTFNHRFIKFSTGQFIIIYFKNKTYEFINFYSPISIFST